jgi:WD40 repeat protein
VWKVTWAHPEFGQVLATCSFDRSVAIWEELISDGHSGERNQSHWLKKSNLVDSRQSVTDVKFAPKHLGLLLATSSSDGIVRIYEAPDIMNLTQWTIIHDFDVKMACSCIAWNLSPFHPTMIAVGSDDPAQGIGKVHIYESSENTRRFVKIDVIASVTEPVHDIAFAPNVGRSYHLLGLASRDVRIISIKPINNQQDAMSSSTSQLTQPNTTTVSTTPRYDIRQVAQFECHGPQVWRVSWNITGTILASSGDDGSVRLWKPNYLDSWKSIAVIKGDGQTNSSLPLSGLQDSVPLDASLVSTNNLSRSLYNKSGQQATTWR